MQRKHAELIKAWADGAEVEQGIKTADGTIHWTTPKLVTWRDNQVYRVKKRRLNIMATFTTEDKEEAYRKKVEEAPYHPGYEDAVVYPTVIVDSGASVMTLGDYIEKENREEMLRNQLHILSEELNKLKDENAKLRREIDNLMDGRC